MESSQLIILSTCSVLASQLYMEYGVSMVEQRNILTFVRQLAEKFEPERVVLFGSYAGGTPTDDSDVDLLVVMHHNKRNVEQSLDITRRVDRSFPLDLIVRKPSEVRRRLRQHDMFLTSILKEGKTLYERGRQRVGTEGRR
jgi:predicted nucleotidyltransferase